MKILGDSAHAITFKRYQAFYANNFTVKQRIFFGKFDTTYVVAPEKDLSSGIMAIYST